MDEEPFIRVSRRGLTGNLSLNELIIFALFVAVCGLALAGPLLTFAEGNPGHHLLSLATYALLCAVPLAFFLAMLLSFLHAAEVPPTTAPVVALAAATFNAAAAAALLLAAVLCLLFFASVEAPAPLGCRPHRPPPDGGGFPWFEEEEF